MYVVAETMRARLASCARNLLLPMGHGPYTRDRNQLMRILPDPSTDPSVFYGSPAQNDRFIVNGARGSLLILFDPAPILRLFRRKPCTVCLV